MSYLLRWRRTDERWCFLGVEAALFFLASIIFRRHLITLIVHSIKGKPTFKTTLTKSSRKCSIELPSFNDRRQKSVGLNRIWNGQKSTLSGRASAAQQNPTLLILRKSKNTPLKKWWNYFSQSNYSFIFGFSFHFRCVLFNPLTSQKLSLEWEKDQKFVDSDRDSA